MRNDFDGAGLPGLAGTPTLGEAYNTPAALNRSVDPLINEFVFNHTGTDTFEFVELFASANADLSTFTVLQIEGDGTGAGVIDTAHTASLADAGGFWTTAFLTNAFENGTLTLLLVEGFSGSVGNDLDTDNDGLLDSAPWARIVDDLALNDGGSTDRTYSGVVLTPFYDGMDFIPGGASRIPNGTDTDTTGDWMRNDFDGAGLPGLAGTPTLGEAYNTPGTTNLEFQPPVEACGDPFTAVYTIQGSGPASPIAGSQVSVEAVVIGDFQAADQLEGFYIQDPTGDGDPATSDGIFVFTPGSLDVAVGDVVRVSGTVAEYFDMTEITGVSNLLVCSSTAGISPTPVDLPVADPSALEPFEGMFVIFPEALYATEHFNLHRFGEVTLAADGRQFNPTDYMLPGPAAADLNGNSIADINEPARIILDDGSNTQFPAVVPYIAPDGTLRLGDSVTNLTGALSYEFGFFRLHPTSSVVFNRENPRQSGPSDVGGVIKVATYNTLNYWTTIDDGTNDARGADSPAEFVRQKAKTIATILGLGADVVGLMELENNGPVAIGDLVTGLNAATAPGTWAYVPDPAYPGGLENTDAIKVGIIYRADRLKPRGGPLADDDPIFATDRPPIAQTFKASGEVFTVVVNHFKSKGCADATGLDLDQGDGQSCYNYKRTLQAQALLDFVSYMRTSSGDNDVIVVGDLNSYAMEDPIRTLEGGLFNAAGSFVAPDDRYSYVFFGQSGQLDHIFTTPDMAGRVTGVDLWHVNGDEPRALDYNDAVIDPAESSSEFNQGYLYTPDVFRSSDHDAAIIGFCDALPPKLKVFVKPNTLWPPDHQYVTVKALPMAVDNFDPNPVWTLVSVTSNESDEGLGGGDLPNDIVILDNTTFNLRAERAESGSGRIYTITYQATDSCGNSVTLSVSVTVPLSQP
jgi:predicted extracellular nuclease